MTDISRIYERPLARAHALAEQWTGDLTPITRSEAAELLYAVLDPSGWTETEAPAAHLAIVSAAMEGSCGCCTFGNHTEPCTCDGIGCCHPQAHTRRPAPAAGEQPHA